MELLTYRIVDLVEFRIFAFVTWKKKVWWKTFSFSITWKIENVVKKNCKKATYLFIRVFRLQSKYDFLDKYFCILLIWTHLKLFYSIFTIFFAEEFDVVLTSQLCTIGDPNARATIPTFWFKPNRIWSIRSCPSNMPNHKNEGQKAKNTQGNPFVNSFPWFYN